MQSKVITFRFHRLKLKSRVQHQSMAFITDRLATVYIKKSLLIYTSKCENNIWINEANLFEVRQLLTVVYLDF